MLFLNMTYPFFVVVAILSTFFFQFFFIFFIVFRPAVFNSVFILFSILFVMFLVVLIMFLLSLGYDFFIFFSIFLLYS